MFALYRHTYPAIACPVTGKLVVVFYDTAAGWSKCMKVLRDVRAELTTVTP